MQRYGRLNFPEQFCAPSEMISPFWIQLVGAERSLLWRSCTALSRNPMQGKQSERREGGGGREGLKKH